MPDALTVIETVVAVLAAATALVVLARATRPPHAWAAAVGTAFVLVSLDFAAWEPDGAAWDGALNMAGYALVLTTYPNGRLDSRWLAVPLVGYLGLALALGIVGSPLMAQPWWTPAALPMLLLSAVTVRRYRRRLSTDERERVRWALLGGLLTFGGMTALLVGALASGTSITALGTGAGIGATILVASLPAGLSLGLLRPRLAPIDIVLVHALRLLLCAVPLALACGLVIRVVPGAGGAWTAAAVAAVSVAPLYVLAARVADRFVYRGRLSPSAALRSLDARLAAEHRADDAPKLVAKVVRRALDGAFVRVEGDGLRAGEAGHAEASVVAREAVVHGGERIGTICVAARRAESDLTRADRRILTALAARSAAALHGARTVSALIDTRAALVIVHEEERKRLRRDLHDDLAPTLVGLRLTASGLARLLRERDPDMADAADAIVSDVQGAIAQTRALAYGLRPPVLDDGGLAAAVRDRARSTDGLAIEITAPEGSLDVPAAVELAALRVVQEAVTNVRRHAEARRCDVRIALDGDALRVSVDDDGHGMPEAARPGLGLASMTERVAELGGRLRVGPSQSGGLRVEATLPVGVP